VRSHRNSSRANSNARPATLTTSKTKFMSPARHSGVNFNTRQFFRMASSTKARSLRSSGATNCKALASPFVASTAKLRSALSSLEANFNANPFCRMASRAMRRSAWS